ncbi:MAG TPA: DUF2238 domain-containing protein [Candidatus Kapabacteria bacterium]|nr:DUF2238 domain-containing protein [Candidatus Kapabacteria bacterium]
MQVNVKNSAFVDFKNNTFLVFLCSFYALFWTYYAFNPVWRPQWWLDNYLVFAVVGVLILSYNKYRLSNFSYACLTIFLCFHAVGANMSYSNVPLGYWVSQQFHFSRPNVFDRIVHFLFGVLFAYPIHEVLRRYTSLSRIWCYILPVEFIISYSAIYEIIEAATAWTLPPEEYDPFIGLQGDIWDGYRDMALAAMGALFTMISLAIAKQVRKRKM